MSATIHVINSGVEDALEHIGFSHSLFLMGIILPVWENMRVASTDLEFLQNTMSIGLNSYKVYGRPVIVKDYRLKSPEGFIVKPNLALIKCETNGIVPYNVFHAGACGVFDSGCDVLYIICDLIEYRVLEALVPTLGRLCRWASSKFEGVYISCRNDRITKKLKSNMDSRDCNVMLI